jgi:glycosyltransferase involved in cell wall biosynthesis
LEEPLGQSQVLPYIKGLAERGHQIEVLSFEKPGTKLRFREALMPNVRWTALRYHRTPTVPATAFDIFQGVIVGLLLSVLKCVDLLHVRSYVPCVIALVIKSTTRKKLLFDTRGLWADEKVDSGSWSKNSKIYRLTKTLERLMFSKSDHVTVLTHAFKNYLLKDYPFANQMHAPITVIPTCTNLELFAVSSRIKNPGDLIYVGSLGSWYMTDEMIRFYKSWRLCVDSPRFILVTRSPIHEFEKAFEEMGIASELIHYSVSNREVPALIQASAAALCFIKPSFSKLASAPTKLGELLACGTPVAANIVGDMAEVLKDSMAGVVVSGFDELSLSHAAKRLAALSVEPLVKTQARALAEQWFDLSKAINSYNEIYEQLCAA